MSRRLQPLFLERESYRRRRLADAARLLPVAGLIAVILPVLWLRPDGEGLNIAAEAVYLFALWGVLIALSTALSRALMANPPPRRSDPRQALHAIEPSAAEPDEIAPGPIEAGAPEQPGRGS